jgi:esterase
MLLNYQLFNPDDKASQQHTPLFILHGLLGSKDNWRSMAKRLSRYQPVFALDLRNHGDSPHVKGMSYRVMADDVLKVAEHEGIKTFNLLGHSMGGKVAMYLALAHQNAINSLIVVDIAPKPYPLWHLKTLQGLMRVPFDTLNSRKEIDDYLKPWIEDSTERTFLLKNLKRVTTPGANTTYQWRCNLAEISKGYLNIAGFNHPDSTFNNKSLFIKGETSPYIQAKDATLILSLFPGLSPNNEIIVIKKAGHLPHFDNPEIFYQHVSSFLQTGKA